MTRDELMAAMRARPFEMTSVEVKGWGTIHIRELTADMVNRTTVTVAEGDDGTRRNAVIVASIVCDESGKLLFDPGSEEDVTFLVGLGFSKLAKILAAANKLGAEDSGN